MTVATETEQLLVVANASGERLDRYLADHLLHHSRSQVQRAIRLGLVTVDGVTATKTGLALQDGQEIDFQPPPLLPSDALPQHIPIDVLYEDDCLLVVNKAAGMVVHPAAGHPDQTLVNALLGRDPAMGRLGALRPGIVHRLDKGTSGCIVVAKTMAARESLSQQFLSRTIFKGYLAITLGAPSDDDGVIDAPISRHPRDRKRFTSRVADGRPARSAYRVHFRGHGLGVVAVRIYTGRTHQIRVHLADRQFPVAADDLYAPRWSQAPILRRGEAQEACLDGPLLHATRLAFDHPISGQRIDLTAPLPPRFQVVLEMLHDTLAGELARAMTLPGFFGGDSP